MYAGLGSHRTPLDDVLYDLLRFFFNWGTGKQRKNEPGTGEGATNYTLVPGGGGGRGGGALLTIRWKKRKNLFYENIFREVF